MSSSCIFVVLKENVQSDAADPVCLWSQTVKNTMKAVENWQLSAEIYWYFSQDWREIFDNLSPSAGDGCN